jgi:uncharacterized protein (DUF433 family)
MLDVGFTTRDIEQTKWVDSETIHGIFPPVMPNVVRWREGVGLFDVRSHRKLLIGKSPFICQGEPHILGTRISVSNIVELHRLLEWNIQKIREQYPHLSEEQIYAALEYYEEHIFNKKRK